MKKSPRLLFTFIIVALFWLSILAVDIVNSLPYNPYSSSTTIKDNIFATLPQGWGFFSKDPCEEKIYLYKIVGKDTTLISVPNGAAINLLGASRELRKVNYEMSKIAELFQNIPWYKTKDGKSIKVQHYNVLSSLLTGNYMLVKEETLPFSWAETNTVMPKKYIFFHID